MVSARISIQPFGKREEWGTVCERFFLLPFLISPNRPSNNLSCSLSVVPLTKYRGRNVVV